MSAVNELVITPEFVTNIIAVDLADETTFTTADKAKLNGIEAGAQVNTVTRVAGKTGAVELNAGDIGYDSSTAYGSGTVGKELTDLNRQISESITPAIEEIETELDGKAPVIVNTVSGDIASFADGADGMPVKSLVANIEPVQDLHGYANPWPAGGGKNKLDNGAVSTYTTSGITFVKNADGSVTANGTATAAAQYSIEIDASLEGDLYFVALYGQSNDTIANAYMWDRTTNARCKQWDGTTVSINSYNGTLCQARLISGNEYRMTLRVMNGKTVNNLTFYPMICASTETDATFAPYSNICPISGHTGASVTRTGKNLLNYSTFEVGTIDSSTGQTQAANNRVRSGFIFLTEGQYTISSLNGFDTVFDVYDLEKNFIKTESTTAWNATPHTYMILGDRYVRILFRKSNNSAITLAELTGEQLELGSTATAYAPYTGNQISITFPTEAGTVYGGTLTLNPDRTGTLVVDKEMVDMGTLQWAYESNGDAATGNRPYFWWRNSNRRKVSVYTLCSVYKSTGGTRDSLVDKSIAAYNDTNNKAVCVMDFAYSDATEFQSAMNGVQLVFELATPITYTLTESEISGILSTLYGTNNIWTDVGTVDVEYPADTKLYIEQLTKPTEDDMTADHAISSGTFFMIGNTLYLATSQIAAGGTITPGTNATKLTLADALNTLNS